MARARFILDSTIVIDLLTEEPKAVNWSKTLDFSTAAITSITVMEVLQGARNKSEIGKFGRFLSRFKHRHILESDSQWAVEQFRAFWLSHRIGINDCLIAAVAARLQLPLYTPNIKDFAPLPDVNAQKPY